MSIFEIVLLCLLIPAAYVVVYIAGKYDILGRLIVMLEDKAERKVDRELVRKARYTLNEFNVKRMVDDEQCPNVVYMMIEESKSYLDKALEDANG